MLEDIPPIATKLVPGTVGALASIKWLPGSWVQRVHMIVIGSALAYFVAPEIAAWARTKLEITGFLVGLFGVAVVVKVFEILARADISPWLGTTLDQLIRKLLGLPAQQQQQHEK